MENVPVKIAENYKPPPRVYQLPQAIANKLLLTPEHYKESPQFSYDFQLERKVLAKIPEWRTMRQLEKEARRERRERREQQQLRETEAQQKQLLGAVNYPSTEDLSSTESDDDEKQQEQQTVDNRSKCDDKSAVLVKDEHSIALRQTSNFHNILQPTILRPRNGNTDMIISTESQNELNNKSMHTASSILKSNEFNYKDFEEDTSSPFDNVELKTINDLDILRQVLHQTQLKAKEQHQLDVDEVEQEKQSTIKENNSQRSEKTKDIESADYTQNLENANAATKEALGKDADRVLLQQASNNEIIDNSKGSVEGTNFTDYTQQLHATNENIPNLAATTTTTAMQTISNNYQYHQMPHAYTSFQQQQQPQQQQQQVQQTAYMPYNLSGYNRLESNPQQHQFVNYNPHNAISTIYNQQQLQQQSNAFVTNCNGGNSLQATSSYFSPSHHFVAQNANNYMNVVPQSSYTNTEYLPLPATHHTDINNYAANSNNTLQLSETELQLKSKSVPDILKELSDEVRNSEMRRRRSRNYSYNLDDDNQQANKAEGNETTSKQSTNKTSSLRQQTASRYYAKLEAPAQKLAKNISSMGFPLERVAKIAQMFGLDDKKIVEHLIPLSELIDLGFDETKISEALVKFDNNKEKALDYLIS